MDSVKAIYRITAQNANRQSPPSPASRPQRSLSVESFDEEDPLSLSNAASLEGTPGQIHLAPKPSVNRARWPAPQSQSISPKTASRGPRLAVVLSPTARPGGTAVIKEDYADVEEDASPPPAVISSDARKRGRRLEGTRMGESAGSTTSGDAAPEATDRSRTNGPSQTNGASQQEQPAIGVKRGRPAGWKPGMSYAKMRGGPLPRRARTTTTATRGGGQPGKKRGRRPKPPELDPEALYARLKPTFTAYVCEWEGCRAELHNLVTLRRHVYVVHGRDERCRWGTCANGGQGMRGKTNNGEDHHAEDKLPDGDGHYVEGQVFDSGTHHIDDRVLEGNNHDVENQVFQSDESFREHVEEAHLVPMGWHVGDGPANEGLRRKKTRIVAQPDQDAMGDGVHGGTEDDRDIPDYLLDTGGQQVTPWVGEQQLEDVAAWRERRRRLAELIRRRDENLPSDASEEEEGDMGG